MIEQKANIVLYHVIIIILCTPLSLETILAPQDRNFSWIQILCNLRSEWSDRTQIIVITASASLFQNALHACFATPIVLLTADMTEKVTPVNAQKEVALVLAEDDNVTWLGKSLSLLPKHPDLKITIALLFSHVHETLFEAVIDALWHEEYINGVILHIPSDSQNVSFYRHYPYSDGNCASPGSAELVAEHRIGSPLSKNIYADYTLVDLKGCVLYCNTMPSVSTADHRDNIREYMETIPRSFVEVIERFLNFKCHLEITRDLRGWGDFLPNGTYFGVIGDLCTRFVDISVTDMSQSASRVRIIDMTNAYREECITGVVLKGMGEARSIWAVLIEEFSPPLWAFICLSLFGVSFIAVSLFKITSAYYLPQFTLFTSFGNAIFYFFQTFLGASSTYHPVSNSARLFVSSWFLFSLVVSAGYIAAFSSLVTVGWYPKDINTLSELVASGLKVVSHHTLLVYFKEDDNPNSPESIIAKTAETNHRVWTETLDYMLKYRDRAGLYTAFKINDMLAEMDPGQADKFHVFKDYCVSRTMVSPIVTRRGSPLTRAIDDAVERVIESGLVDHWLRALPQSRRQELGDVQPFSLRNVISAFVVHAIGMIASTVVFIFERMSAPKKINTSQKSKKKIR